MTFTTHIGTHVNVPYHMVKEGKRLDQYSLSNFFGEAGIYNENVTLNRNKGVIFRDQNIDKTIAEKLIQNPPKFVGLSEKFEFDIELEKLLLQNGIISYQNLTNTDKLPDTFIFYGLPLNIKESDGSPVRAFAQIA